MNIREKELTPEQQRKVDELYDQWIEEAKTITEPDPPPQTRGMILDGRPSGSYHELTMKYRRLIREVIGSEAAAGGDPHA